MKKGCEQVVDKGVLCAIKQKYWGEKKGCNVLFVGRGLQRYPCVAPACSLGSSSRFTVSSVHKCKKHSTVVYITKQIGFGKGRTVV